jgi:hypothetical protein
MPNMNRLVALAVGALTSGLVAVTAAQADHRPVIAVPGHPQVPAIVDGVDASYGVVIGEWGLYRAGHIAPKVIRPLGAPRAYYPGSFGAGAFYPGSTPSGYYPSTGNRPRYGRQEVELPGERVPRPAESYPGDGISTIRPAGGEHRAAPRPAHLAAGPACAALTRRLQGHDVKPASPSQWGARGT